MTPDREYDTNKLSTISNSFNAHWNVKHMYMYHVDLKSKGSDRDRLREINACYILTW